MLSLCRPFQIGTLRRVRLSDSHRQGVSIECLEDAVKILTYSEKLKDARWQRRRLEVLERESFTCQDCGASDKTPMTQLHVHHCFYERGLDPWQYDDSALMCLCNSCHTERQSKELSIQRILSNFSSSQLSDIHGEILYFICIYGLPTAVAALKKLGSKISKKQKGGA